MSEMGGAGLQSCIRGELEAERLQPLRDILCEGKHVPQGLKPKIFLASIAGLKACSTHSRISELNHMRKKLILAVSVLLLTSLSLTAQDGSLTLRSKHILMADQESVSDP